MSKRIVIPKEQLPNLIAGEAECFIRFRIISSDRNRLSAWTPIFSVTPTIPYSTQTSVDSDDTFRLSLI